MNEQELLERLGRLPREREPEQDLWPGVASRIGTADSRRSWIPVAVAAAITGGFLTVLAMSFRPASEALDAMPGRGASELAAASVGRGGLMLASGLDLEYGGALRDLSGQLQMLDLDPGQRESVQASLKVLQDATEAIRDAIAADPDAIYLAELLATTHRKRLDVLRGMIRQQTSADQAESDQRRT